MTSTTVLEFIFERKKQSYVKKKLLKRLHFMHACVRVFSTPEFDLMSHGADYAEAESADHQLRNCFNIIFIRIIPWIGDIRRSTPTYQKRRIVYHRNSIRSICAYRNTRPWDVTLKHTYVT